MTYKEIEKKFGLEAKVEITLWAQHKKDHKKLNVTVKDLVAFDPKKVIRLKVMFPSPKFHLVDGDACSRDGVRVVLTVPK